MLGTSSGVRTALGRALQPLLSTSRRRSIARPAYQRQRKDEDNDDSPANRPSSSKQGGRPRQHQYPGQHSQPSYNDRRTAPRSPRRRDQIKSDAYADQSAAATPGPGPGPSSLPRRSADPLSLSEKKVRVAYQSGQNVKSAEQQAFFRQEEEEGVADDAAQLGVDDEGAALQLVPGQVVEGRRV